MAIVSIDTSGLRALIERLGRDQLPEVRSQIARRVAFGVIGRVAQTVPVDTGRYRAGWIAAEIEEREEGAGVTTITVTNPVEYGGYVEHGTATRPPGNHLAVAIEEERRELGDLLQDAETRTLLRDALEDAHP